MVSRNIYLNLLIRVLLLLATALGIAFAWSASQKVYTLLVLGLLLILQAVLLLRYLNRTNREILRFLASLRDPGSATSWAGETGSRALQELSDSLNETGRLLEQSRVEAEQQSRFMQFLLDHLEVAVLAFGPEGKVRQANKAFERLFGAGRPANIRQLNTFHPGLEKLLSQTPPGGQRILRVRIREELRSLVIRLGEFRLGDERIRVATLQDFSRELEETELGSWKKLIRVMRHEIMNSLTSITTLTEATRNSFMSGEQPVPPAAVSAEMIHDMLVNNELIGERSWGMIDFVQRYKEITDLPRPHFREMGVQELLEQVTGLLQEAFARAGVEPEIRVTPVSLSVQADRSLLEQVLINLLKNALQAVEGREQPAISIRAYLDMQTSPRIDVHDNGPGIAEDIRDLVFVPFYSTREGGSGIGLSLAREIMHLHRGSITFRSDEGQGTVFSLRF